MDNDTILILPLYINTVELKAESLQQMHLGFLSSSSNKISGFISLELQPFLYIIPPKTYEFNRKQPGHWENDSRVKAG